MDMTDVSLKTYILISTLYKERSFNLAHTIFLIRRQITVVHGKAGGHAGMEKGHKSAAEFRFLLCQHFMQKVERRPKGRRKGNKTDLFIQHHLSLFCQTTCNIISKHVLVVSGKQSDAIV
jgi:hypothetical protein